MYKASTTEAEVDDVNPSYYDTAGTGTAEITLNNEGQLYQSTTSDVILTMGDDDTTWTIDGDGGYAALFVTTGTDADGKTTVLLDMDGAGGTDITFTLTDADWLLGDTIAFTITQTEEEPADVNLTMPTIATDATIGNSGVVSWDLAGTTAENVTGYASTSVIRTLVHDGYSSGSLKSISVTADGTISGFFTN
ncbi:MAG: hypothetical protein JRD93_18120, partial [Deltaproteobacteria bacterium]|nr:hypothetical protein [Deltaproteobacteria bacterium]